MHTVLAPVSFGHLTSRARFLHRFVAVGSIALVIALGVCSASPELHEKLHAGTTGHGEDHCAVALFSAGVSLGVGLLTVAPPQTKFSPVRADSVEQAFLISPRYLRQPERGPPGLS